MGDYQIVDGKALKRFLVNACYSDPQAHAIEGAVRTVIGTTTAVGDEAARRFTVAFYRALGNGFSIKEAFRDGGDSVELHGLKDVFKSRGDLDVTLIGSGKGKTAES
jgi:hypothetical protein